jgi:hypothetical protein
MLLSTLKDQKGGQFGSRGGGEGGAVKGEGNIEGTCGLQKELRFTLN